MADLIAAEIAREGAVTGVTLESQARSWRRFQLYLMSIGLEDDRFLTEFSKAQQNKIMCAFAMAMRQAQFSGPSHDRLVEGTIKNTISNVCATFRENGMPNPTKDNEGQLSFLHHDYTKLSETKLQIKCSKKWSHHASSLQ